MSAEPLIRHALQLLARGHSLYAGGRIQPGAADAPGRLRDHADRLTRAVARPGAQPAAARSGRMADELLRAAGTDTGLIRLLDAAHTDRESGRHRTAAVLADGYADRAPAADTPMGTREVLRRMASRLRTQGRHIHRSRRRSRQLGRQMRRLSYTGAGPAARRRQQSAAGELPLGAVRYHRSAPPVRVRQSIAAALDRLGIDGAAARRNWMRGYETLIARESAGRASAIASEPATAPGPAQADGRGLGYARGLTQTIPATFARYHQPGTSADIYDPVANICASMNYVMHRYGVAADGADLAALVQQADPHRPPKGY